MTLIQWVLTAVTIVLTLPGSAAAGERAPAKSAVVAAANGETNAVSTPAAEAKSPLCNAADELWIVNTRCLDWCPDASRRPELPTSKFDGQRQWHDAKLDALVGAASPPRTLIWVHGNRISDTVAIDSGWEAYRVLRGSAKTPVRLVIWSWPSDKVRGQIRDVREKGARTDTESVYLGWFLAQLPAKSRVDLVGYSYGSRIITGGLHLAAGGEFGGAKLPSPQPNPTGRRAALMAGAVDNDWILPGNCHGRAVEATERMLALFNPCDKILKWYPRGMKTDADALGYTGLIGVNRLGPLAQRVSEVNVSGMVGGVHDWQLYLQTDSLTAAVRAALEDAPSMAK